MVKRAPFTLIQLAIKSISIKSTRAIINRKTELLKSIDRPSLTKNLKPVTLMANIANAIDLAVATKYKANGVGLLRTEFLLMDRTTAPTEEEQFLFYKKVITTFPHHSTTIRTFDMGGDKIIPYINMAKEENPFLGVRAIRLCLKECNDLFQSQLRAILRASVFGKCQIMIPMITTLEEIMAVKANLAKAQQSLQQNNIAYDTTIKLGIMVETPAAAIMADVFAAYVDFFSIGTNDLIQYVMAADRQNGGLNELSHFYNPSVFRMISMVSNAAKHAKIEVSVCGSMARDPLSIIALLSAGIDKLSMGPNHLLSVKKFIGTIDTEKLSTIYNELLVTKNKQEYLEILSK
ncbi:MAG: phosphoenolpyruvate--protein phosphotransferase [Bacteriovoracaceae bacterium]